MGRNYWMASLALDDFEVTRDRGFSVFGMGRKYRKRAQRMQPNDRMLLYVKQLRKWTAAVNVASPYFEDRSPIWNVGNGGDRYPYRVRTRPDIVLDEADYIDAMYLAPRMDYLKRWLPELWPLAFFDALHLIPQRDFNLIESEMKRIVRDNANRRGGGGRDKPAVGVGGVLLGADGVGGNGVGRGDIDYDDVALRRAALGAVSVADMGAGANYAAGRQRGAGRDGYGGRSADGEGAGAGNAGQSAADPDADMGADAAGG